MKRREVLGGGLALSGTLLAGCNALPFVGDSTDENGTDDDEYAFFLTLSNATDVDRRVELAVTTAYADSEKRLAYDLRPRSAREHVPLSGTPTHVAVTVDGESVMADDWPRVESCRDENSAGKPGLAVQILTGTDRDDPRVETNWSCQAVEPAETE